MPTLTGVIIEESLRNPDILRDLKITDTKIVEVNKDHQTPHLNQWSLHTVEIKTEEAEAVAEALSQVLLDKPNSWYTDFKNDEIVYIIFPNKVYKIPRTNSALFDEAREYGISLGIPDYQVDFSPEW